ncbi:hydroxyectoine utilization dehydratase EutB [Salibacterium halotolerans]|uniref:threonine ammonia-lyase n=1 Tax=Salibacterium halotolerans TaxID=1884432 RepID=A0A1I5VB30_9BACI|nr:hydroxyectoine utilization dehydratase EutB [Salibacterium halotolerans]SFQ04764.1 threonine dehydratase [Salibacterium halotolerans]
MTTITVRDIWTARNRIRQTLPPTPLILSPVLSEKTRVPVYLKLEQMQPTGAFKLRGAINRITSLPPEEKRRGVITFSTGNHGFATAYAAAQAGIQAVVCVSKNVPQTKIDALEGAGAELHMEGQSQDEAADVCARLQEEKGYVLIPPFDHPDIIAGQGTIGLEILDELPDVQTVAAGLSGGGLLSGIGLALKGADPSIQIAGLSVKKGAAMDDSIQAGKPIASLEHPTYADSLLGGIGAANRYTLPMVKQYVDERIRLSEESIARGMAFLYETHRFVVEGAAAVGVSALLDGAVKPKGPAVAVVTGNNVGIQEHQQAVLPWLSKRHDVP